MGDGLDIGAQYQLNHLDLWGWVLETTSQSCQKRERSGNDRRFRGPHKRCRGQCPPRVRRLALWLPPMPVLQCRLA